MLAYNDVREAFHRALKSRPKIREHNIPFYHKWARDYLEWCSAALREPGEKNSTGEFAGLLREAGKP